MICNYMNYNVLIALVSTSVLQNFWRNLPLKGSIPGTYPSSRKLDHAFSSASRRFSVYLGSRTRSPRPKSHNFLKMEKAPPRIHPSYKCAKFQTFDDLGFLRAPRRSLIDLRSGMGLQPHTSKFSKNEKSTPKDSPKL